MNRSEASKQTQKDRNFSVATDPETILLRSKKFREWMRRPFGVSKTLKYTGKTFKNLADPKVPVIERHFSPAELAKAWGVDSETIRNLFRAEPGVLKIGDKNPKHKRTYLTLRIPESIAVRVHRRLSE
jgi:hypothetical protein